MSRRGPLALALVTLVLAGCGGEQVVSPTAEEVEGSVPTQTATTGGETGEGTTGGGTTTQGGGGGGGGAEDGMALFASNGCGSCHTFEPAGTDSQIGPPLDDLEGLAEKANQPLEAFTRESIVQPDAYVEEGYQPIMPSFASLSDAQVTALVEYLTEP
jgi:cytochrome c551/c552